MVPEQWQVPSCGSDPVVGDVVSKALVLGPWYSHCPDGCSAKESTLKPLPAFLFPVAIFGVPWAAGQGWETPHCVNWSDTADRPI